MSVDNFAHQRDDEIVYFVAPDGNHSSSMLRAAEAAGWTVVPLQSLRDILTHPPAGTAACVVAPLSAIMGSGSPDGNSAGDADSTATIVTAMCCAMDLQNAAQKGAMTILDGSTAADGLATVLKQTLNVDRGERQAEQARFDVFDRLGRLLPERGASIWVWLNPLSVVLALAAGLGVAGLAVWNRAAGEPDQ